MMMTLDDQKRSRDVMARGWMYAWLKRGGHGL